MQNPESGVPVPGSPRDGIDAQILAELRRNARISLAQLGEKVLLSRNAVRQRIERMERDGFIKGYTIRESAAEATRTVNAVLMIQRHDRMRGSDVIAGLRAIPEIATCDVVSGELDLIVRVEAPDAARIQEIWRQVSEFPGVRDITTALSLSTVIDRQSPR
ncbi:Lrp/AsnC family transcriptional regulator [Paenarthrobacter sp. YJN-D]|nr:Lrp/AsnC family transcriptional regulator [Paenarthrobacter sp. YJN-D]